MMIPNLFDHESHYMSWYDDATSLYGEPFSSPQDTTYDGSLYLTYKDEDDWSWYTNRGGNEGYGDEETPHNNRGTLFEGYTPDLGRYLGENKETPNNNSGTWFEGYATDLGRYSGENKVHGAYGSSIEAEGDDTLHQRDRYWNYYNYYSDSDNKQLDYVEDQGRGHGSFCLGGDSWDGLFPNLENLHSSSSWDDWELEETILCERIFGQ